MSPSSLREYNMNFRDKSCNFSMLSFVDYILLERLRNGLRILTGSRTMPCLCYRMSLSSLKFVRSSNLTTRHWEKINNANFLIARNRLESFIRSRSEWCISRQRVWGVPIPALHHIPTDTIILNYESLSHIIRVLEQSGKGAEYWWEGQVEEFLPPELQVDGDKGEWKKCMDTMDVWFDSGTSWSMLEGLDNGEERIYRADVCLEGSDQHRGWFQSQLLTALGAASGRVVKSPYGALITHGMVLDQKGRKMSKSIGNVVSPMVIINGGKVMSVLPFSISR